MRKSLYSKLNPIPIKAVRMCDGFWKKRMDANYKSGIPAFMTWMERDNQTAPFPTFARTDDPAEIQIAMNMMNDCFIGRNKHWLQHTWRGALMKTLEACAYILQAEEVPHIRKILDELVAGIVAAHKNQDFWDAYYGKDFENSYQLATPGHLIQAAIAHHRTTGSSEFLNCACNVADAIIKRFPKITCIGHPCIEMALVDLYRVTGKEKYLKYARQVLQPLLQQPGEIGKGEGDYIEDPHNEHFGRHVVRQTYLCAGGADYIAETGNREFLEKLESIWNDMTTYKSQISGHIASERLMPERIISEPFLLHSGVFDILQDHVISGYELCEAVGNAYWNWRMLIATGNVKYTDYLERILYNGFLAHVSLDGSGFHYVSPLATDGDFPSRNTSGSPEANCCPPNALRTIASIPGYIFSTSDEGIWIHLYDNCHLDWQLEDGTALQVIQKTDYPCDGKVTIEVYPEIPTRFVLNLRIPDWCDNATVKINNKDANVTVSSGSYCRLERDWKRDDVVTLNMSMPIKAMIADPRAHNSRNQPIFQNKTALMRGPLLYCFENIDNPNIQVWDIDLESKQIDKDKAAKAKLYGSLGEMTGFKSVYDKSLLNGVVSLILQSQDNKGCSSQLKAVPFYAWNNRGPSPMRVWVGLT